MADESSKGVCTGEVRDRNPQTVREAQKPPSIGQRIEYKNMKIMKELYRTWLGHT